MRMRDKGLENTLSKLRLELYDELAKRMQHSSSLQLQLHSFHALVYCLGGIAHA